MRYVAFLRAINLGATNKVQMAHLRGLFEEFGFADVETYIQTGNVVFSATGRDTVKIQRLLEQKLAKALGFPVGVFVLSKAQLEAAASKNPFEPEKYDHEQHTHLVFLSATPAAAQRNKLIAREGDQYRFAIKGSVLYYAYSRALAGNRKTVPIEKILGVTGTARTWKVVNKMIELLGEQ
jgi:uncharacterized protein (DUF1697 family)